MDEEGEDASIGSSNHLTRNSFSYKLSGDDHEQRCSSLVGLEAESDYLGVKPETPSYKLCDLGKIT